MKNQFGKSYFENEMMDEKIAIKREGYTKLLQKMIMDLPLGSKILDVGCGRGAYLKDIQALRSDLKLYGVDVAEVKDYLPETISFHKSSGDNLPFKNNKFDLVMCFHVLEHVINPLDFVREFYRVLKKGGLLYIEMPYYKTTNSPEGNLNFWSDPTHIRPYNHSSMERLLQYVQIDIIKIKVWRSYLTILISPYLLCKRIFLKDYDAWSTLYGHLVGHSIGALGKKVD